MSNLLPAQSLKYIGYVRVSDIETPAMFSSEKIEFYKKAFKAYGINPRDTIELYFFTAREKMLSSKLFGVLKGMDQIVALKELLIDEPRIPWPISLFVKIYDIPNDFYYQQIVGLQ